MNIFPRASVAYFDLSHIDISISDLETSLLALEKLDRASPDLWPDHSE